MGIVQALFALILALFAVPAAAQSTAVDSAPPSPADAGAQDGDIVVTGFGGSGGYRLSAERLREAVAAFDEQRAAFAPDAPLLWKVLPADGQSLDGLVLVLRDGDEQLPITLDADGRFALPHDAIRSGEWRLVSNRPRSGIRITPEIFSPGTGPDERRFGDLRLQCRVFMTFADDDFSLLTRMAMGVIGPCVSRRVRLWLRVDRPLASVSVSDPARTLDLGEDAMRVLMPLHDESIANDARLAFRYR